MTKKQKIETVENLISILSNNQIIYLVDFSGINAEKTSEFRRDCFKYQAKLQVIKNTLLKKAIELVNNKKFNFFYDLLKGNTALIISKVNNIPAKIIKNFREKIKYKKPIFKGAYIEESFYIGDENLINLINIKSKEELIIDIIVLLQSSIKNVIFGLQSENQKILNILQFLSIKKI